MGTEKFSISTTQELFDAIEQLRDQRGQDRSSLIEMLLREHPLVREEIKRNRGTQRGPPGTKRGRSLEELNALARVARRRWEKEEAAGQVAFLDR